MSVGTPVWFVNNLSPLYMEITAFKRNVLRIIFGRLHTVVYFGLLVDISPTFTKIHFFQLVVDRIVQNKKYAPYYYPIQLVYASREEKQKPTGLENSSKLG